MAPTTAPPTLFQSAAAALTPGASAAQRDAQELYRVAVDNVRNREEHQNLSQLQLTYLINAGTTEELLQASTTEISRHKLWRPSSTWRRVGAASEAFERFRAELDSYAEACPSLVSPIYTSICLVAKVTAEVLGTQNLLNTYQNRIFPFLRQYETYVLGYDFDTPLREAIIKFYEASIQFCLTALSLLSQSRKSIILRTVKKSPKAPFDTLFQELDDAQRIVNGAMQGESHRDGKVMKRTWAQPQYLPAPALPPLKSSKAAIGVPDLLSQDFTGRSWYLDQMHHYFKNTSSQGPVKIALWGIPGVGKTQLALAYLKQQDESYTHIMFINSSSKDTIISAYRSIASLLDLVDVRLATSDLVVDKVKHWLANNARWLLIYDNVNDHNEVLQFSPTVGGGHIVLTMRDRVTAETLARPGGRFEIVPLPPDSAQDLALRISLVGRPPSDQEVLAARAIADFTSGLPLAIEQFARLARLKQQTLSEVLHDVKHKKDVLRMRHPASLHERNLSTGALLLETLDSVGAIEKGAVALFKLLVYFEPSQIPILVFDNIGSKLELHFARVDTYNLGHASTSSLPFGQPRPKQSFRLDDYDPFSLDLCKKIFGRGIYSDQYTGATLPRTDSSEDRCLQDYWNSFSSLRDVLCDRTNIRHSLNLLSEAGLLQQILSTQSLWIHDLFAEMTTMIDQEHGSAINNAHLAATMVYLSFPVPVIPGPFHILDKCLLVLPSAQRSHGILLKTGILNNTTIGAELSHLIASTILARGMKMANLSDSTPEAIKFYRLALAGYVAAYKRLSSHPQLSALKPRDSTLRIILATFADVSEAELYGRYLFSRHHRDYERFGRSAPWRALQTSLKLGDIMTQNGQLDDGLKFVQVGVSIAKEIFGATHWEYIDALNVLLLVRLFRKEDSESYKVAMLKAKAFMGWQEKLGRCTDEDGSGIGHGLIDSEQGLRMAVDLGDASAKLGKTKEAERWYQIAMIGLPKYYGADSGQVDGVMRKLDEIRGHRDE